MQMSVIVRFVRFVRVRLADLATKLCTVSTPGCIVYLIQYAELSEMSSLAS